MVEVEMSPLQIRFLGATHEVGRAAIAVKTSKTQILLDYGVMLNREPGFPIHIPPREVDAIILGHSHLDHSGAIPIFFIHGKKPVYTNRLTAELTQLLISDFIHLSSYFLPYEYLELRTMMRNIKHLDFGVRETVGDITFEFHNAGHIPGSAQVLLEAEGRRLLYTSDFNLIDTRLLEGAKMNYRDLDAVIIESTYANEDHPNRAELEKSFVEEVTEVVEGGGTVLVPAFSIGRAQEIACILTAHHFEHPVYLDGMAREASRLMMNHLKYLRDPKLFMDAVHSVNWVEGWRDRRRATKTPCVIISPAGMLKGGPAAFYVSKIGKKSQNAIFLVSYQIPGTPGRELLEKGVCIIDGKPRKVKATVKHFDFSSHCGAKELREAIQRINGKAKIYVIHGADGNCELLAKWAEEEMGLKAVAPKPGDTYEV
jgi:putative mRNA 3-end processing factor